MDKIQQQREHFNAVADRYREARTHGNHLLLKDLIWSSFLEPHKDLGSGTPKVLEAMCGFGDGKKILETTLNTDIEYEGFDYSDEVLETLKEDQPELKVFHADAGTVELPENTYDIIILLGGLHHVPHIAKPVVERLCRAIKPGGHFINLEPTNGNPVFKAVRDRIYDKNSLFDEETERAFDVKELFDFFESAGMQARDITYPGLSAYVMYYNPDAFPFLNRGGKGLVKFMFALDRLFMRNRIGRIFSFATLSLWQKPKT